MADNYFKRLFFLLSALVFIIVATRAFILPFCCDESSTFFYFIQNGSFLPFTSPANANNHILNSFLAWVCFHCFGSSPFSLRLPNLFGLIILIIAVYRLAGRLTQTSSKVILIAGLLLSFHWLGFFSMCRGYGLSMSLMALAISYLPDYVENKKLVHLFMAYFLLDLAICANLTLIICVVGSTLLLCLFQLYHRRFFKMGNILMLIIHSIVILFWVKYSFFLQQYHQLYTGAGSSYWNVTFVSLIYAIVGKQNIWINMSVSFAYAVLILMGLCFLVKNTKQATSKQTAFILFLIFLLNGLIIGFYLLKKLYGINFPENRAALFFYMLFILNAAFIIDIMSPRFSTILSIVVFIGFVAHFAWNLNFNRHPLDMYITMPERFYDRLVQEQKESTEKITIGGSKFRELTYEFMNYRHNGLLNNMDAPDNNKNSMIMNADYYIGKVRERKYYAPYYREIDSDKYSGFTLLKRKEPLTRKLLFSTGKRDITANKTEEYFNFFELKDTTFNSHNPLTVEFNFKVQKGDMPSQFWLVIGMDSAEGKPMYYRRIPFNWIKYKWVGDEKSTDMVLETGPLPKKIHRFVCYLWNSRGQSLDITMNFVNVFQLEGLNADVAFPFDEGYF